MKKIIGILGSVCFIIAFGCESSPKSVLPNIVIIYADDMGYGDLACQNPASKIPTPYLDQLASEGMRFTDAHSSSGICSPSRFALLTGMYHWRRQHGIVGAFGQPFFKDSDQTLPQLLKQKDYRTACIGKWHLGWNWPFLNDPSGKVFQWGRLREVYQPQDIDWSKPIAGGPLARGFDYYYGDGTINFPPYAWMENDRMLGIPNADMNIDSIGYETKEGNWEFRPGPKVEDWNPYEVLPTLTTKTVEFINQQQNGHPFFLYFALPSPHAPIIPNDEFDHASGAGAYGDFVVQTDWVVGQILEALRIAGFEENTLVIFSSDNGPEAYAWERALKYEHFSMGNFRGLKRDVWEGGHHVPFIWKWPGRIQAGSVSDELISQIDVMNTLCHIVGVEKPEGAAPDSYDLLPVLLEEDYVSPIRPALVHNTYESIWAIRQGDYLYIDHTTGGHREMPEAFKAIRNYTDFETPGLLFNMKKDPGQRENLFKADSIRVNEMSELLQSYRQSNQTNPLTSTLQFE